ncbi:MAG: rhamnulokinase [Opitutales bacterium]|nr:rhamnulokinase [Opitutales bacterium]
MANKVYLAVDLGAGSGRLMAAVFDSKTIQLEEVSRWASAPVKVGNSYHWDVQAIFNEIVSAVKKARSIYGDAIVSLGIDTWGVDYGLLDESDNLLNMPYIYRDSRTDGMMDSVFAKISKKDIYEQTGIQFMFFNTIFQIASEVEKGGNIGKAKSFLMMPDLLAFMLTGVKVNERTNASTTQMYNPFKRDWSDEIIAKIGAPEDIFKNGFAECGDVIGLVREELRAELGDLKVVAVASHDTASAVAATPARTSLAAYINSGTWSLPGVELKSPVATDASFAENFTNEVGAENTIRFLKNVTGMWLVQKSKEVWKAKGIDKSYAELEAEASTIEPMRTIIDPDAPDFVMPEDMPQAIANYAKNKGLPVPETHGQIFRTIQESIALKYAYVFNTIEKLTGVNVSEINVMGGGSRDAMLNQFTANATGRVVLAGPTESTALGNTMMQMKADGVVSNLAEARAIISASCEPKIFEPCKAESQMWAEARERFASAK